MINKVVYINYQPLTEKVKEDFYFNQLLENKFIVEYWDLSSIYFSKKIGDKVEDNYICYFDLIEDVENKIKIQNLTKTLFISLMTFEYKVLNLHKLFSKYNCITGFFARGASPHYSDNSLKINHLSRIKKIFNFNLLINYLGNNYCVYLKKFNLISCYSVVFSAGELGITTIGRGYWYDKKKSKIIDVNSFDFENYLLCKNNVRIVENKYCLYLDEYLPFHPDFDLFNIKTIDSNNFYNVLNRFFDNLEKEYGIDVVIAAHPKAHKYKTHNYFNNRKIIFNETPTLSRDAEFIIAHNSSSINFAVLNKKPVISILTNDIINKMNTYSIYIKLVSISINSNLIIIDDDLINNLEIPNVDISKYNEFKYYILTSNNSENFISSKIFIKTILSI